MSRLEPLSPKTYQERAALLIVSLGTCDSGQPGEEAEKPIMQSGLVSNQNSELAVT